MRRVMAIAVALPLAGCVAAAWAQDNVFQKMFAMADAYCKATANQTETILKACLETQSIAVAETLQHLLRTQADGRVREFQLRWAECSRSAVSSVGAPNFADANRCAVRQMQ